MRKVISILTLAAVLLAGFVYLPIQPASAQTAITSTALSAALTQTARTFTVVSATGFTASTGTSTTYAYMDREAMQITGVSGTTITVIRGQMKTNQSSHRSGTIVFTGTATQFIPQDPSPGSCTRATDQLNTPLISANTGNIWDCSTVNTAAQLSQNGTPAAAPSAGTWQAANFMEIASSVPYKNPGNAAYTALLSDYFIDYNSITAARTVTLPAVTDIRGKIIIVKHSGATATLTVAPSAGQYISTIGTTTFSLFSGDVGRFISVGGGWATF